ncbi:MAG: hypothetical protein AB7G12_05995 [Thermoanaerobaculia bacterium]
MPILQILPVGVRLGRWVQNVADRTADPGLHQILAVRLLTLLPLLELDDDRLGPARLVVPANEAVEPLRCQWQFVFEENAVVVERGALERQRQCAERVLPGSDLAIAGLVSEVGDESLDELAGNPVPCRVLEELGRAS